MNEELIASAVGFLKDPNVGASPLTKKVEFLESKGLSASEIEEALKRANGDVSNNRSMSGTGSTSSPTSNAAATTNTAATSSTGSPGYPPIDYYNSSPPLPERSWKDYFIMATATAGVTYGVYQVVSKYLIPSIIPPTQSSIEKDMEKIDEEFIKIDKLLEQLTEDQSEIKQANETKLKEIDTVINNVNDFLSKYNKDKLSFDDDLRLMKLEIDNLRNSVEKNMSGTKENIREELSDIGEELTSLKQLIISKNNNIGADSARKLAPVSSIPTASDILKKAKAKKDASPSPSPPQQLSTSLPTPGPASTSSSSSSPSIPQNVSTKSHIYAAGIPQWQLNKKLEEEEREKAERDAKTLNDLQERERKELETTSDNTSPEVSLPATSNDDIPSWQKFSKPGGNDEEVTAAIAKVGVPSWQLNASV